MHCVTPESHLRQFKTLLVVIPLLAGAANAAPGHSTDVEAADQFVKTDVMCSQGKAYVAVTGRQGGIAQRTYKPINVTAPGKTDASPITCDARGYILRGAALSNYDLAMYARGLDPDEVYREQMLADAVPVGRGMVVRDSAGCAWWVKELNGKVTSSRFNMRDGSALCESTSPTKIPATSH
jgi:hypothetical protein